MMKFIKKPNESAGYVYSKDTTKITMTIDHECLADVISEFEFFLRGCGFFINGHLDIVEDEVNCKGEYTDE